MIHTLNIKKAIILKKVLLTFLIFTSSKVFSQDNDKIKDRKNEIHLNALSLILNSSLDVSYEYLLKKNKSVGVSFYKNFADEYNQIFWLSDEDLNYSITMYYRYFLLKKQKQKFFAEAFVLYSDGINYEINDNNQTYNRIASDYSDVAIGCSLGVKLISKQKIVAEFVTGIGRNILNTRALIYIERVGVNLGYRF